MAFPIVKKIARKIESFPKFLFSKTSSRFPSLSIVAFQPLSTVSFSSSPPKAFQIGKKHAFFVIVLLAVIASFFCEWIPADRFSIVSYSYFLMALYLGRCYLFCLLIMILAWIFKTEQKAVSERKDNFKTDILIFAPTVLGGIFILCGFPFNVMMNYSRIVTVAQTLVVMILIGKSVELSIAASRASAELKMKSALEEKTPIPQTMPPMFSKLSKREKEVAALVLAGKTNDEIAEALFISVETVKSHVKNIFKKYNARNRMEFSNKAHEENQFQ